MRRAERLFRLVAELRSRPLVRAADLAKALEISTRTVYRDIAHLQASGLPIDGEAGIGYMLRPGFDMPNLTFTHDQIDALAIGLAFVEQSGDAVLSSAAREVRISLQAALPDPENRRTLAEAPYFSLLGADPARPDVTLIRSAIRERRVLGIDYQTPDGRSSHRMVRPLVVWQLRDGWMVSGWCELRTGFRTFRVDRMQNITPTDQIFEDDAETGYDAYIAHEHATDTRRVSKDEANTLSG